MEQTLLPVGVKRDGSLYSRVLWASTTESDPTFWVCNLLTEDHGRNGGTYGANAEEKVDVVLDFFGETKVLSRLCVYKNVGIDISVPEELCRQMNIYISEEDAFSKLRTKNDRIDTVKWTPVGSINMEKEFGWEEITFEKPIRAKYVRIEMAGNFCKPGKDFIPWIETSEVKLYPAY